MNGQTRRTYVLVAAVSVGYGAGLAPACGGRIADDPPGSVSSGTGAVAGYMAAGTDGGASSSSLDTRPLRLAAGDGFTCAASEANSKCWGQNADRQLGAPLDVDRSNLPVTVSGTMRKPRRLAAGSQHACALVDGVVSCWGDNKYGQLGVNWSETKHSVVPVHVTALGGTATDIAVGGYHSCAIVNGNVYCWGGNVFKQLGTVTMGDTWTPVAVQGVPGSVSAIAARANLTCALSNGAVYCWGDNGKGQLGLSDGQPDHAVAITGFDSEVVAVAPGMDHACALTDLGKVECWGDNSRGQLGNDSVKSSIVPVKVSGNTMPVSALACGHYHCCLLDSGTVACWGAGTNGEHGSPLVDSPKLRAIPFAGVFQATAVASGTNHSCAIVGPYLNCWGGNEYGQLGNGSFADSVIPVLVAF